MTPGSWQEVNEPSSPVEPDGARIALAHRADEAEAAYRMARERADRHLDTIALLRVALLATRDHDEPDGPCWCRAFRDGLGHTQRLRQGHGAICLHARAALAGCSPTRPGLPSSIRGLDPDFTTELAPRLAVRRKP